MFRDNLFPLMDLVYRYKNKSREEIFTECVKSKIDSCIYSYLNQLEIEKGFLENFDDAYIMKAAKKIRDKWETEKIKNKEN